VNIGNLRANFQGFYGQFTQVEQNQKVLSDADAKFNILMERLNDGNLNPLTLQKMQTLSDCIEQANHQGSGAAMRELTQLCWGDIKEFSNALKVLSSYR